MWKIEDINKNYEVFRDATLILYKNGKITAQEKDERLLENALWVINKLKVAEFPEDQTWEQKEYGYMVKTIN